MGAPYFRLKSALEANIITFDELIERLRDLIRLRIDRGEFTERSLARMLGISQPHLHNMLKGARRISVDFADQVMWRFRISVLDLISDEEMWQALDEKDPHWLTIAGQRKPASMSAERESDPRAQWREEIRRS